MTWETLQCCKCKKVKLKGIFPPSEWPKKKPTCRMCQKEERAEYRDRNEPRNVPQGTGWRTGTL